MTIPADRSPEPMKSKSEIKRETVMAGGTLDDAEKIIPPSSGDTPGPATKTCKHGHVMTPENTYVWQKGKIVLKQCRLCQRDARRRYYHRAVATPPPCSPSPTCVTVMGSGFECGRATEYAYPSQGGLAGLCSIHAQRHLSYADAMGLHGVSESDLFPSID